MNPYDSNPFPNQASQQVGGDGSIEYDEMMQMRLDVRDSEHLKLLAIFHYIWAGLVALGGVLCIGYMMLFGTLFNEALRTIPTSHPSSGSSIVPPTSTSPVSPVAEDVEPALPSGGSGTSVKVTPTSTSYTSSTMPTHVVDSMMRMMYIIYGVFAGLFLIGAILNFLSAWFMQKRKHRVFSMVVGAVNLVMFPLGTVLGVFTFIVLCRQSLAQKYIPVDRLGN